MNPHTRIVIPFNSALHEEKNEQSLVGRVDRTIGNLDRVMERVHACGHSGFLASKKVAPTNNRIIKVVVTHHFAPMDLLMYL